MSPSTPAPQVLKCFLGTRNFRVGPGGRRASTKQKKSRPLMNKQPASMTWMASEALASQSVRLVKPCRSEGSSLHCCGLALLAPFSDVGFSQLQCIAPMEGLLHQICLLSTVQGYHGASHTEVSLHKNGGGQPNSSIRHVLWPPRSHMVPFCQLGDCVFGTVWWQSAGDE